MAVVAVVEAVVAVGLSRAALNAAPLTSGAKPEVLYIGAEFCPICATERWAMVVALSKFRTFSGLSQIRSANRDGEIATLDFYRSRYIRSYLTFAPVEVETNQPSGSSYKPLQTPTAAEESLWVSTMAKLGQNPAFPFVDMDGKYLLYTSQIPDTTLSGLDWTQSLAAWRSAQPLLRAARLGWALVGVATAVWLIYAELFELDAVCLWCTAVHAISVILFALTAFATAVSAPTVDDAERPAATASDDRRPVRKA